MKDVRDEVRVRDDSPTTSVESYRRTLDNLLEVFRKSAGEGVDAYSETATYHAMADAKYLQALASLHRSGLLSSSNLEQRAAEALSRLTAGDISPQAGYALWGLGFAWNGWVPLGSSEPYLITTSMVCRALLEVYAAGAKGVSELKDRSVAGLIYWFETHMCPVGVREQVLVPAYSASVHQPVWNAAAHAAGTIAKESETSRQSVMPLALFLADQRIPTAGWPYAPGRDVIDLVHQAYIVDGLSACLGPEAVEWAALGAFGHFGGFGQFADRVDWCRTRAVIPHKAGIVARALPFGWLVLLPRRARLWSIGELLVVSSRFARAGVERDYWIGLARMVAEIAFSRLSREGDREAQFPRHAMHVAHGLAEYLETLRTLSLARRAKLKDELESPTP